MYMYVHISVVNIEDINKYKIYMLIYIMYLIKIEL